MRSALWRLTVRYSNPAMGLNHTKPEPTFSTVVKRCWCGRGAASLASRANVRLPDHATTAATTMLISMGRIAFLLSSLPGLCRMLILLVIDRALGPTEQGNRIWLRNLASPPHKSIDSWVPRKERRSQWRRWRGRDWGVRGAATE